MAYFKNFPDIDYKFGNELYNTTTPNLLVYTDVIDSIKDQLAFYEFYTIQNERPDQLAYKLYGNSSYYWTFFLMNDTIRRQGWPLGQREIEEYAQKVHGNTTVTTRSEIGEGFTVGGTATGVTSQVTGTIIRRNLDLGQIVLSGTKAFATSELLQCDTTGEYVTIFSVEEEYNSPKEYLDTDGLPTDIIPEDGPGSLLTEVSYMDYYKAENEKLRTIRVIKPDAMNSVVSAFNQAIRTA